MTWMAWRLQRSVSLFFVVLSLILIAYAMVRGLNIEALRHQWLGQPCHGGNGFSVKYQHLCQTQFNEYSAAVASGVYIHWFATLPTAALGLLLGASTVAGEIDHNTVRTAWTQSVTRGRWFMTKVVVGVGSLVALAIPLCVTTSWWLHASQWTPRLSSDGFTYAGWLPLVTGIFAFAAATTIGTILRRPGWALAVGLGVMVLVTWTMQTEVRAHLVPLNSTTITMTPVTKKGVTIDEQSGQAPANAWVIFGGYEPVTYGTAVPTRREEDQWSEAINQCTRGLPVSKVDASCQNKLDLRVVQLYVADSEYWTLQLREGGLYLAGAGLLLVAGFLLVRRIVA